ncbi:MAG: PLP-dependent aminotransferase family protein [Clostridium sp.]|jgi:GntR family transcriptional regulator/MocR family aminotransferase|uniref:MocR-like pyridoxine biosynthesis transcription factor PdxR n=1 Tax=Clostridium sp. TaxID=1506 RepID=UPI0025B8CD55|nr:PLP-dependent aminotransferase family protein [Clostridium sp.]MCH3965811.1 PLP-dependent aminotransferase family protein [Clostridium sp.]MCI1716100.1 PLP-dependent aminotransferase family protein [Clostridium sp.]MCI1800228.1 PLP-dependent aminotransferase family protein [Clostridium sp.]MCI1814277.1 PLP-dependent aminotransferase family protein [Clostridium sp.]MCI1871176.1 PLP-dependent aminotransferase family protein [Clostridium sp.]
MIYINIDRESKDSLAKQIYSFIKESVLCGTLQPGEKLPSSRELSKYLNIARNMVVESYEQLISEGYAYSKSGSGTYVSDGIQFQRVGIGNIQKEKNNKKHQSSNIISFRTGIPDLDEIPIKKWAQMYHNIALDIKPSQMDYQNPFGDYELRTQISLYLNRARGACTFPENILITNGAAQSFSLLCQLVPPDCYALVENPLSYGILHTLESNHIQIKPIRLDEHGMVTSELPDNPPRLIFTTPSHQFPTGVILPVGRRIEMIRYAQKHNAYIVEDDYDSEFRFDGNPIQSMQYLDPERVVYVGTFSKTLMPALRIGYMVLPNCLCKQMKDAKFVADLHSPILEQLTLAEFIETGLFEHHIRKMRKLYLKKRNHLIFCLNHTFDSHVAISGAEAGLHFVASFDDTCFNNILMHKIENKEIQIAAINKHYLSTKPYTPYDHSLIFGYGNTKIGEMEKGIKILSSIL